jgi:hypothetical protein
MAEDFVKREEYSASIGRIHDKTEAIKESVIRIEVASKHTEEFTKDIHKLLYGNGNDGYITKVDKKFTLLFERTGLHSKILVGIFLLGGLGAVVAAAWKMILR